IMDEHLYDDLIDEIRTVSKTVHGVIDTEKCFIRKSGMKYHVDLHAIVDGNINVREGHDIAHLLKDTLRKKIPNLGHVLIHVEPD
ncbi:MAG: cation transporter dimerization domain-containing protein, partial [Saprospiraceae bacterium]